jgi:hypothetical protein
MYKYSHIYVKKTSYIHWLNLKYLVFLRYCTFHIFIISYTTSIPILLLPIPSKVNGLQVYDNIRMYFCLNYPTPTHLLLPPSDKPVSWQAISLQQHACRSLYCEQFCDILTELEKRQYVRYQKKMPFHFPLNLFSCSPVHIFTAMSLCTPLLLLPVHVHAEMLIYDQSFPSDLMHAEVRIITSICRTKYALYNVANVMENTIQHSPVQYFSLLTSLKTT